MDIRKRWEFVDCERSFDAENDVFASPFGERSHVDGDGDDVDVEVAVHVDVGISIGFIAVSAGNVIDTIWVHRRHVTSSAIACESYLQQSHFKRKNGATH